MKVAVLIPCYNEAPSIGKVVADFRTALPEAEIFVYDNNSTDGTARIAAEAGAVVRTEPRQGKGFVIRSMFREIDADVYLMVDGDDTYPAEAAPHMIAPVLRGEADMVIGDRLSSTYFTENKRRFHNAGNRTVRFLINRLFRSRVRDIMTGYRAFGYDFAKSFPVLSGGFEIETEMTVFTLANRLKWTEIPVTYRDRAAGSVSKLHTVHDGLKVLKTIFFLYKDNKPLSFFNACAVLVSFAAAVLGIPVLVEYFETGLVPRFPTLIASGFLMISSLLCFFAGVVLDTLAKQHRQDFERHLNGLHLRR